MMGRSGNRNRFVALMLALLLLIGGLTIAPSRGHAYYGSWEYVGNDTFDKGYFQYPSLVLSNGIPYAAGDFSGSTRASVLYYNGSSWVQVGGTSFAQVASDISLSVSGTTPYVAFRGTDDKAKVMKYDGTQWVTVGSPGFSYGKAYEFSLYVDGDVPYVAYRDASDPIDGPDYVASKITVKKFANGEWTTVGSAGFSTGPILHPSLVVDNGTPYVAFTDTGDLFKAKVMKYDGSGWVNIGDTGSPTGYTVTLQVDHGTPYISFTDGANGYKATVQKYDGSQWVTVGDRGFSLDSAGCVTISIADGTLYVAYTDPVYGNKVTVQKYDGSRWSVYGDPGFASDWIENLSFAVDRGGVPYVLAETKVWAQFADGSYNWDHTGEVWTLVKHPPTISLSTSPTSMTNGTVTVGATATAYDTGNSITVTKWAYGSQEASYFADGGTAVSGGSFTVSDSGYYTVYTEDANGNEAVQTIMVGNISRTPPTIYLSAEPIRVTDGWVTITAEVRTAGSGYGHVSNPVLSIQWAEGDEDVLFFRSGFGLGMDGVGSGNTVMVDHNATYTIYAVDSAGNDAVKKVTVSNIQPSSYQVIFGTNGGTLLTDQYVSPGGTATVPGATTRAGFTFAGWYADSGLTVPFDFSTPINAITILYAKWVPNSNDHTVSFDSGGGTAVSSETVADGGTATLPNAPTRSGYTFAGWYADSGLTVAYDFAAAVTSDLTLYAKWTVDAGPTPTYNVAYNGNGAASGSVPADGNAYEQDVTVSVYGNTGGLAKPGYTFAGWNTAADGSGTPYSPGATFVMGAANVTLYAQWTAIPTPTYNVAYNGNGAASGSVPADGNAYEQDAAVTVLGNPGTLTKPGYTFAGWNTAADGSGTPYSPGATFAMGAANVTLYAQWTAIPTPTYNVAYNGNGAASGSVPADDNAYEQDAAVTVLGNPGTLTKPGYTFAGWNTAADGSGTPYSPGATFAMGAANVTLYAQWTAIPTPTYNVAYNGNGAASGSVPADSNAYEQGAAVTVLGNPGTLTKPGYTFAGWNTAADGSGTGYSPGATFAMGAANVTLYAQWTAVAEGVQPVLTAQAGSGEVTLAWSDVPGTVAYSVYEGAASGAYGSLPVATVTGSTYSYTVAGLATGTTYYFIIKAYNDAGIGVASNEAAATPLSGNAYLHNLTVSGAALSFDPDTFTYQSNVANSVNSITVTPTTADSNATVKVNGTAVTSGQASGAIALNVGGNPIAVVVTAQDGKTAKTYNLIINRVEMITASSSTPIQVTTEPKSIIVPAGVTNAAMTVTTTTHGSNKEAMLPTVEVQAATSLGNVGVAIPDGTKITAPAAWDGTIMLPQVLSSSSVAVNNGNVSSVIELGSTDVSLLFDKAVRLLIPNQGGKKVGFIRNGVFTEITGTLSADTQTAADSEIAAGGDAQITIGNDLVVWTKHFTKFVSFTPASSPSPSTNTGTTVTGGGGGAAAANYATIAAASGGTVTLSDVTIEVPAGAIASDIQVTLDQVSDTSMLPVDNALHLVSGVYEIKKDKDGDFVKPVSLTLPYDRTKVISSMWKVGLYWLNEQSGKWKPLDNPKADEEKGTASGSVTHFAKFAVLASDRTKSVLPQTNEADFADIKGHWSEANVRDLVKLGAIKGYPDGTFKPNANITRAEFVTVIVKALHLEAKPGKVFSDTESHWAKDAIATAVAAGIVNGDSDINFGPDDPMTREQMAAIVVRAAKLATTTDNSIAFSDSADISDWSRAALATATAKGLVNAYEDGMLKPKANTTRAEAVTVILRVLHLKSLS